MSGTQFKSIFFLFMYVLSFDVGFKCKAGEKEREWEILTNVPLYLPTIHWNHSGGETSRRKRARRIERNLTTIKTPLNKIWHRCKQLLWEGIVQSTFRIWMYVGNINLNSSEKRKPAGLLLWRRGKGIFLKGNYEDHKQESRLLGIVKYQFSSKNTQTDTHTHNEQKRQMRGKQFTYPKSGS